MDKSESIARSVGRGMNKAGKGVVGLAPLGQDHIGHWCCDCPSRRNGFRRWRFRPDHVRSRSWIHGYECHSDGSIHNDHCTVVDHLDLGGEAREHKLDDQGSRSDVNHVDYEGCTDDNDRASDDNDRASDDYVHDSGNDHYDDSCVLPPIQATARTAVTSRRTPKLSDGSTCTSPITGILPGWIATTTAWPARAFRRWESWPSCIRDCSVLGVWGDEARPGIGVD